MAPGYRSRQVEATEVAILLSSERQTKTRQMPSNTSDRRYISPTQNSGAHPSLEKSYLASRWFWFELSSLRWTLEKERQVRRGKMGSGQPEGFAFAVKIYSIWSFKYIFIVPIEYNDSRGGTTLHYCWVDYIKIFWNIKKFVIHFKAWTC